MKAKKISHTNTNPVIEDEIKTAKKELDIKYQKMNYLKYCSGKSPCCNLFFKKKGHPQILECLFA